MKNWAGVKRFYKKTSVISGADGIHVVTLDECPVKTPIGEELGAPSYRLAKAMASEWDAQKDIIDLNSMPLCKLTATVIDRLKSNRDNVIAITLKIAETDLLCYRAKEPDDLVKRQRDSWNPELKWAQIEFGAALHVTSEIIPIIQPESALVALQNALVELDDYNLIGVSNAAAATGSLILAFSMYRGQLDADIIFEKSVLEELYQMELWGVDHEAVDRHDRIRREIQNIALFFKLLER
jgi:chaperone required for assembly of F1-ATPase